MQEACGKSDRLLVKKLKKDYETGRPGKGRSYYKSAMVIVDEVGYTPIDR